MDCYGKRYIILGLGLSGRSAAKLLLAGGALVEAYDDRSDALRYDPAVMELMAAGVVLHRDSVSLKDKNYQGVVLSPGIPSSHPLCRNALSEGIELLGEIELACRFITCPCIGVTGTNGKTTVTAQIAHTLNYWGIAARPLGNIGTPLAEQLLAPSQGEVLVLELSSYQLETMRSRVLDAAVFLNLTPDHLDRYASMEEYGAAKARIGSCLKEGKALYVSRQVMQDYPSLFNDAPYPTVLFDADDSTHTLSPIDRQNNAAVAAICSEWKLTPEQVQEAAHTFKKDKHRMEFVATVNGIDFIDDSKGTNFDAVVKAVQSIDQPIILIAGGLPKGASFEKWAPLFQGKVRAICAIGEAAGQMERELGAHIPVTMHITLQQAVRCAYQTAENGTAVLLSPGCASFDMFRDYAHRGEIFKESVIDISKPEPKERR